MKKLTTPILIILMVAILFSVVSVNADYYVKIGQDLGGFNDTLYAHDRFGDGLSYASDFNGDGVPDIVIGAPYSDFPHIYDGAFWVMFLNSSGYVTSSVKIGEGMGGFGGTLYDGFSASFGRSLTELGDLDSDGVDDLAVTEPGDLATSKMGAVWILFMNANGTVKSEQKIAHGIGGFYNNYSWTYSGFGSSVANIGDLNNDGVVDIAVGDLSHDPPSQYYVGGLWILFLNTNGTVKAQQWITNGVGGFGNNLDNHSCFGWRGSIANIGDLDNDGVTDIAVGAQGSGAIIGTVWILFMNTDGTVKNEKVIDNSAMNGTLSMGAFFGGGIAGNLGDLDGDGVEDIVIGAAGQNDHNGSVFITFLRTDGTVKGYYEITSGTSPYYLSDLENAFFGCEVANAGDINNDGLDDLLVGAYNSYYSGNSYGAAYLLFMQNFTNVTSYPECNDGIDNDGDGFIDYPYDPSCDSVLDDSEAPFDYFQCNDGIDNDGDGWIDMADPHCSAEADNSELPYDQPFTGVDDCFVVAGCLLYDSVPYSDSITSHGWYGVLEQTRISGYQGGYSIFIDGYDPSTETLSTVNLRKDITHSNIYDNVTAEIIISFLDKVALGEDIANESFGISFLNENGSEIVALLLNISTMPETSIYDLVAEVFVMNSTTVNYVGQAFMRDNIDYGLLRFNFRIDQINGSFNFNYTDSVGTTQSGDYLVSDVSKVQTVNFLSTLNSQEIWIYMNVVEINAVGNFTTECNDGIDNDGDWFADYPSDPSCSSPGDNSESPYDYTECNDGIDNDFDGFIDLADPRCNHPTDPTEFPSDYSQQDETECLAEEDCLFYEQFPYTDSINLHGWEGNIAVFVVEDVFGSNRLDFDNLGYIGFDTFHNITNENTYSNVRVQFDTFVNKIASTTEYFYIILEDYSGKDVLKLKYELVPSSQTVKIYYWNTTHYELIVEGTVGEDEDSLIQMVMDFDQVLKTWDFTVNYATGSSSSPVDFAEWSDVLANKVYKIRFVNGNFNSANWDFWIDNILISGIDTEGVSGSCDTWNLPYYLVESFIGYLSDCDWVTTHRIWANGNLSVTEDINFYSAHKRTDLAEEKNTRYVTMTFDLNIVNIAVIGSTITFRLYDEDDFNFVTIFFRDSGDYLWYNDGGSGEIAGMITLNQSFPYKFVIDFIDDEWDIYYNGTSLVNNSDFTNSFANVESLQTFKVTSSDATFNLDNLAIFGSDATGTPLLPDDELTKIVINDSIWCGLFYKTNPVCTSDEDCVTGDCLPGGTCNRFNMAYCDEEGYTRGNKCMFAGVSSCFLTSTEKLVIDNFFFVVLILLLIMGLVYLKIMFSRGS